jgi:hypothetical protein
MVSGFKTSPLDCSKITSGDAKEMVILLKLLCFFGASFLNAIVFFFS